MRDSSQFPRFSRDEMADRHAKVEQLMDEGGVEAVLFYTAGSKYAAEVYWLTDWPGGRESYVLFQKNQEPVVLFQLYNHWPMARVLSVIGDVRWAGPSTSDAMGDLLQERKLDSAKVGLIGSIPYRHYQMMREKFPRAELVDLTGKFRMLRAVKSNEEIDRLRIASRLTDESLGSLKDGLREGIRENELPLLLESVYLKAGGYAGIHFMTSMPMRSPHFPVPAQYHSNRRLQRGDCLITEISGGYWGYTGQIHRTFSLGEGPTREWQDLHAAAVEAFDTIAGVIKEGTSTREVEAAAEVIHRRGYTIYDDLLHGASQFPPIIQTKSSKRHKSPDIVFRENMAIVIQPNVITRDEKMGLQFGETLVVGKNGCETLNAFPREWVVCGG